jgi:hypothetical protein
VLVREEVTGTPDAALHLVGDEQRLVPAQQVVRGGQVARRADRDALALDRLHEQRGHVAPAQLALQGVEVAERERGVRQQRGEALAELVGAVDRQGAGGEPVEGVVEVQDAGLAGEVPGELQRRLDGLGTAVAEVDAVEVRRPGQQGLAEQPGERRRVELGEVGQVEVEDVVHGLADHRVVPAQREDPEAGEHVEVLGAVLFVQVRALGPGVDLVETDGVQHAWQLVVEVPRV